MSCQVAPITRSKENQQDASSPVSDLLLRSKQKLTSLRWIGWLRLGMIAQACGARKISKTLQDHSPTDCCGANISSHRFVQFDGDQGTPEGRRRDAVGTPEGRRRDAGGTPGRTSDPLAVHIVPRLPRKSGGDQGTPEGRRRDGGTPEGRRRDARAYIRPLGSAHCLTPATQTRRKPRDALFKEDDCLISN